jgi:hypothetical protein
MAAKALLDQEAVPVRPHLLRQLQAPTAAVAAARFT